MSALRLLPLGNAPLQRLSSEAAHLPAFELFLRSGAARAARRRSAAGAADVVPLRAAADARSRRWGLLSYDKGAIAAVLASGILPSLMASAVMPVPLVGVHQSRVLQTHVGLLEAITARRRRRRARRRRTPSRSRRGGARPPADAQRSSAAAGPSPVGDGGGGGGGGGDLVSGTTAADLARLNGFVQMLAEMGFEPTLKAVGMYGEDMAAAVAWLTDDQAQQQVRTLQRSPSWTLAEELANMLGAFSVGACKKALARSANDANAAAMWLLDNSAAAGEVEAEAAAAEAAESPRRSGGSEDDDDVDVLGGNMRTVSFKPRRQPFERAADEHPPADAHARHLRRRRRRRAPSGSLPTPRAPAAAAAGPTPTSTFVSAAPPPPPLPAESGLRRRAGWARCCCSRARGRTPPPRCGRPRGRR